MVGQIRLVNEHKFKVERKLYRLCTTVTATAILLPVFSFSVHHALSFPRDCDTYDAISAEAGYSRLFSILMLPKQLQTWLQKRHGFSELVSPDIERIHSGSDIPQIPHDYDCTI